MDFYAGLLEPIFMHVRENAVLYAILTPTTLIFIFFTRKYSIPLILYVLELAVYSIAMHTVVHAVVRMTAWFKTSSSMKMLREDGVPADAVYWTTPWLRFWETETYDPSSIMYVEIAFLVIILLLMYRFRPIKTQYVHKSRFTENKPAKPGPKKKGGKNEYDDDDWGVPKQRTLPDITPKAGSNRKR